jgi:ABC-type Fe3+-siderophore transport system permease subunit
MNTTTTILAALLVAAFALLGSAKLAALPAMRSRAEHVGFSVSAYRRIGALELLGVAGLLVGVAVPVVGVLAGVGLLLLMGGAVTTHVRHGDGPKEVAPAAVLGAVAVGYLVLVVGNLP